MSDMRGPVGHDLPEYEPNGPDSRVRARVYKVPTGFWYWSHDCPSRSGIALGWPKATQTEAFQGALGHARRCW